MYIEYTLEHSNFDRIQIARNGLSSRRSEILLFYSMSCTNKLKLVRCNDEVRLGVGTSKGRSMIGRVPLEERGVE